MTMRQRGSFYDRTANRGGVGIVEIVTMVTLVLVLLGAAIMLGDMAGAIMLRAG